MLKVVAMLAQPRGIGLSLPDDSAWALQHHSQQDDAGHGGRLRHQPRQSFSPGWRTRTERSATSRSAFICEIAASSVGHVRTTLFWPFGWMASTR